MLAAWRSHAEELEHGLAEALPGAELFAKLQTLSAKSDSARPELVALRSAYAKKRS